MSIAVVRSRYEAFCQDEATGSIVVLPDGPEATVKAEQIVELAYNLEPKLMVRSLDVLHLASALSAQARSLVSVDKRQRAVAQRAGLKLLPPTVP